MTIKNNELDNIKRKSLTILKKNGIKHAGLFGSYARGEQKKSSDIDILVEFDGSLLKLAGIEIELENKLKKKVDLLTYKGIHPYLKERILKDEVKII